MSLQSCPADILFLILQHLVPVIPEWQTPQVSKDDRLLRHKYGFSLTFDYDGTETPEHNQARNYFRSLALACKYIKGTAMMMLYGEIFLPSAKSMVCLLRTLLRCPGLRAHIRSLTCPTPLDKFEHEREIGEVLLNTRWDIDSMPPFERAVFGLAKCEAFCLGRLLYPKNEENSMDGEEYHHPFRRGSYLVPALGPSVLASLLCLIPNITRFCFVPPVKDDKHVYRILRDSLAKASKILTPDHEQLSIAPRLSTLALFAPANRWSVSWDCLWIPFWARLSRSGIKRMELYQGAMDFDELDDTATAEFDEGQMEEYEDLRRFVRETKWDALEGLQTLSTATLGPSWSGIFNLLSKLREVDISPAPRSNSLRNAMDPSKGSLDKGLLQLIDTLERLQIRGYHIRTYDHEIGPGGVLSCLPELIHLRYLDIATVALFKDPKHMPVLSPKETLPKSLETLLFREEWQEADEDLIDCGSSETKSAYSLIVLNYLQRIISDEDSLPNLRNLRYQQQVSTWHLELNEKILSNLTKGRVLFTAYYELGQPIDLERWLNGDGSKR